MATVQEMFGIHMEGEMNNNKTGTIRAVAFCSAHHLRRATVTRVFEPRLSLLPFALCGLEPRALLLSLLQIVPLCACVARKHAMV